MEKDSSRKTYDGKNDKLIQLIREKWTELYDQRFDFPNLAEYAIRRKYYSNIITELQGEEPASRLGDTESIEQSKIEEYGDLNHMIETIYAKNHTPAFSDIAKHNEGIKKSMLEFAKFYHELLTTKG